MNECQNIKSKIDVEKAIKSLYDLKNIFSFLSERQKLDIILYNKHLQNKFNNNIKDYKRISVRYKVGEINGKGKEYDRSSNKMLFEGEYLNGKRNGKGKEYYYNRLLIEGEYLKGERYQEKNENSKSYIYGKKVEFEGEYLNGKRNGQGKEYYKYGNIKFEGVYINGDKWNGKGYDTLNNISYELKNGIGTIKEYYDDGKLKFEGEYINGKKKWKWKRISLLLWPIRI